MAKQSTDPRPSRANHDADPRPTGKPKAADSLQGDSPAQRVQDSPTSDPGQRELDVRDRAQQINAHEG